ncbi:MAG: DUF2116 family Zn-ribbon domain-containing protein [Methanosphaera sp.]|uniref:DUF2116 family Zn-ribbon domain-containing protein n=1 Tax=Methanosphaera sp. TaxID=2666342 RepID=UPI0025D2F8C8|nr:DUF2116 family Zn-ribbon domain-containing protein [Methanosphaera sp.]MCI5867478.1 DUF2116 family Zn-ribbon domain-containing protein [Methanosphaera sp.]MDD6534454.1 DUF2116 family Zn-ribbon domain-containing protein [Methanosphaera sp.]MDY3955877.1 DUF2116 family Zn-ribbon domain-containing protein [Methanosphaera sp.]
MAVEAHKHCAICGQPIPLSESFCSDKCEEQYRARQKQMAKQRKILYAVIAIFVVIYLVMMIGKM